MFIPAGTIVAPNQYAMTHDPNVYPEPDALIPERWLDPESSANKNPRNFLVFGSGPHRCIGIEYVYMNISICISNAVTLMEWEHEITPLTEEVEYVFLLSPLVRGYKILISLLGLSQHSSRRTDVN